jgi:hypothetical protein
MLPHAHVHRGRCDHRPAEGQAELRENVVRQAVRELRQGVRRERRDDEQVGVDEMRIEVACRFTARKRLEGMAGYEALGVRRQDRRHLVPRLDEETAKLARLVGGDSTRDPEKNSSHRGSLKAN